MAVIWADFPSGQLGLYGDSEAAMLNGVYASLDSVGSGSFFGLSGDPDPNIGSAGRVYRMSYASGPGTFAGNRFVLPTARDEIGFSFRLWMSALPSGDNNVPAVYFSDQANGAVVSFSVLNTGALKAINNAGTTLATTTGPVLVANAFNLIEFKAKAGGNGLNAGEIEIRVNGFTVIQETGLTFTTSGDNGFAQVKYGVFGPGAPTCYWKDVVYWDTTGTEINDFLGNYILQDLIPEGDDTFNWTASDAGATGYNLIDDNSASGPDDADFISADDTLPPASVFTLPNLPEDVTTVKALISIGRLRKSDGGDATIQMSLSPDGSSYDDGDDRPITTSFTYYWDVSHLSPATASPWTPTEVNEAVFKINRTT